MEVNACKILYLRHAAIEYLKFTGKDAGNKLERELLLKLQNTVEVSHLRVDGIMYYDVYGHLYVLSKSSELGLSAYSMNCHYFELLTYYLSELMSNPDIIYMKDHNVFSSEKRIYESNSKFNHHMNSPFVYDASLKMWKLKPPTYIHYLSKEQLP